MLLAGEELLERKGYNAGSPKPISEAEAREALSGILCRCTGYVKPVQALLKTAARLRGEEPPAPPASTAFARIGQDGEGLVAVDFTRSGPSEPASLGARSWSRPVETELGTLTESAGPPRGARPSDLRVVGKSATKVDAVKLAQGKPAFTDDVSCAGMLIGKILHSPVAHARIKCIDVSKARALPGVAAVLTYQDIPRVVHSTAGQSDPLPSPLDTFSLDSKVRFVGDRVALRRRRDRGDRCSRPWS